MRITIATLRLLITMFLPAFLVGCGNSNEQKIADEINRAMADRRECVSLPVLVPADTSKVGNDGALGLLKQHGYIEEGQILVNERTGRKLPGFTLTAKGKSLLVKDVSGVYFGDAFIGQNPCISTGKFIVKDILAVDYGQDMQGRPVATVRVTFKFVPEDWIATTVAQEGWQNFWNKIRKREQTEMLVGLLKSGDRFYFERIETVK